MHKEKEKQCFLLLCWRILLLVCPGRMEPPLEDAWRLAEKAERIIGLLNLSQDASQAFKTQANALDIPEGEHSGHKCTQHDLVLSSYLWAKLLKLAETLSVTSKFKAKSDGYWPCFSQALFKPWLLLKKIFRLIQAFQVWAKVTLSKIWKRSGTQLSTIGWYCHLD